MTGYHDAMKRLLPLVLLMLLFATGDAQSALRAPDLVDREAVIEYAAQVRDVGYLSRLSESLALEKARGDAAPLPHYYAALAAYRAAEIDEDVELRVGVLLDRCLDQVREALKLRPEWPEALALAGACHGLAAQRQPLSAIIAGNFAAREHRQSLALAPENPRVLLLQAVTMLRRFEDPDRVAQAEAFLLRSVAAFGEFAPAPIAGGPSWGEEQAHYWLGYIATLRGDKVTAREHLERALLIAPEHGDARVAFAALGR